ncbi:MAG TPA: NAD(P)/FAD-dependent oxidoreductase [Aeromicrobium sp.]|nr:NAD(P)/FAD-dependent oxidoreductase [Aeromicrobium sp.]HKY57158.1 NAD(P)/FAD-dependent oxidoreductase [Aeromicrobium sp.]
MSTDQTFDAVVIGARCAGSGAAIALGRAGRRVLMIDRAKFPSDTLSTHVNFPSAVAEIQALGALDRVLECDPPKCHQGMVEADGVRCLSPWQPVDGIDYGICVPRIHFDDALVRTAVEDCGVELREKTALVDLIWEKGRVVGALLRGPDGVDYEVRSKLLVGADGRRSTVARLVGSERPYRGSNNNRACAFFYMDDPKVGTEWRDRLIQLRMGPTHALIFPCPDDRVLCLFMGPREDIPRFRADPEAMWQEMLRENPAVAERLGGATNISKLRSTADNPAYFRASSGPGWILAGDAGHFKDPIIGQGMRDAMRFGRLWGEAAAPVIDDPRALDRAMRAVEARRDRECMATYHWGNRESRIFAVSQLHRELLGGLGRTHPEKLLYMFDRVEAPHRVLNPLVTGKFALKALFRRGVDRRALLRDIAEELRIDAGIWAEEFRLGGRGSFRSTRQTPDERRDWQWPPLRSAAPPRPATGEAAVEAAELVAG